jgi:hypothetical protein
MDAMAVFENLSAPHGAPLGESREPKAAIETELAS